MASPVSLPSNVHVSKHPCLQAKLSQFRSRRTTMRESKTLVHEIGLLLGAESLSGNVQAVFTGTDVTPLNEPYDTVMVSPERISLVPILRSGLGMVDAMNALLPAPVPVHHLGLFREPTTLQPVEYYNNLPFHEPTPDSRPSPEHLAIILDPIIATGGTAVAAIQSLKDWGVTRILFLSVLGTVEGMTRAAEEWPEGTTIWVGGVDEKLSDKGMIVPGVGDVGDRLFGTKGK